MFAKDQNELESAYADWAPDYDQDVVAEGGYIGFKTVCDRLLKQDLPKDAMVLDAGCGTGLSGEVLAEKGYKNIDGLDFSQEMLDQAEEKGVYQDLTQADLMKPLDLPDNKFDAIVCAGTFTLGHVGPEALNEMIRVTKPGGYICFTVRDDAWKQDNFQDYMDRLTNDGDWEVLENNEAPYLEQDESSCQLCLCKVA